MDTDSSKKIQLIFKEVYPRIYVGKIPIDIKRNEFYDALVKDHKHNLEMYKGSGNHNFELDYKYKSFTEYLYDILLQSCEKLFGEIKLYPTNKKVGWAYVTNKHEYRGGIHDHYYSATINSVYYLNVPSNTSGKIEFYNAKEEVIYSHQPSNDELIIFPYYMLHQPLKSDTEDYRIAINLEILCNNIWSKTQNNA